MVYQDFENFLRPSLAEPSMIALRKHYPRWRRRLAQRGIDTVPSPLSADPRDARAINMMNLLARQASRERNARIEHHLRDLTGIRADTA
jgi:hypothetical protein